MGGGLYPGAQPHSARRKRPLPANRPSFAAGLTLNSPFLTIGLRAARIGAGILRKYAQTDRSVQVRHKGPADYVTDVDIEVENAVFAHLQQNFPAHAFWGEESGRHKGRGAGRRYCWVLDPLDGTANFLHGFPHFCLSLALEDDGRLECAVIIDPIRGEEFTAVRGRGAYRNERRLRPSAQKGLKDAMLANSSHDSGEQPGQRAHDGLGTIRQLYRHSLVIRRTGSAALDLAYVASGRLDGFWGSGLKRWDLAAGLLLATEAGGYSADYVSDDADPYDTGRIICAAPGCFAGLAAAVRDHLSD